MRKKSSGEKSITPRDKRSSISLALPDKFRPLLSMMQCDAPKGRLIRPSNHKKIPHYYFRLKTAQKRYSLETWGRQSKTSLWIENPFCCRPIKLKEQKRKRKQFHVPIFKADSSITLLPFLFDLTYLQQRLLDLGIEKENTAGSAQIKITHVVLMAPSQSQSHLFGVLFWFSPESKFPGRGGGALYPWLGIGLPLRV